MRASSVAALVALRLTLAGGPVLADETATGTITIDVVDKSKKGVAGVSISAMAGGAGQTTATGSEQPSDAELAAAARQGPKAIAALNSKFAAHASITDLPLGVATITIDAKGAKPITVTLTKDKPTWTLTATVDAKSKRLIGTPKVAFDEVANARAQAERAKAETAKAKAAQDSAKAARDRAEKAEKDARERTARADADTKNANDAAAAERWRRAKAEAPSKISLKTEGCKCTGGQTITVKCMIASTAEVPVDADVTATAATDSWPGMEGKRASWTFKSSGARKVSSVEPGKNYTFDIVTKFSSGKMAVKDCSSCRAELCRTTSIIARDPSNH